MQRIEFSILPGGKLEMEDVDSILAMTFSVPFERVSGKRGAVRWMAYDGRWLVCVQQSDWKTQQDVWFNRCCTKLPLGTYEHDDYVDQTFCDYWNFGDKNEFFLERGALDFGFGRTESEAINHLASKTLRRLGA